MARERGVFNFSGNLEVKKEAALDARLYVPTFAELTQASTWQDDDGNVWLYNTMVVGVGSGASAALYMLTDKTKYTQASAWVKLTTGGDLPEPESDVYMIGDLSAIDADSAATITAAQIQERLGTPAQVTEAMTAGKLFVGKYDGVIMAFNVYTSGGNVQLVGQAFTDLLSMTFKKASSGAAWQQGVIFSQKSTVTEDVMESSLAQLETELTSKINLKANSADVYTKTQTDAKIDEKIGQKVANVYTAKGSYPNLSDALGLPTVQNGWVFSIENEFELNGKTYPAGTNIAYVGSTDNQASVETNWDPLGGSFDMGEIEQSISEGDTSTLSSAKTYADTQDADFLAQAKTYAQSLFQWHDVGE